MPLNYTFFLPVVFCVVAALTAHILRSNAEEAQPQVANPPAASIHTV
jgi:hypothetical protein